MGQCCCRHQKCIRCYDHGCRCSENTRQQSLTANGRRCPCSIVGPITVFGWYISIHMTSVCQVLSEACAAATIPFVATAVRTAAAACCQGVIALLASSELEHIRPHPLSSGAKVFIQRTHRIPPCQQRASRNDEMAKSCRTFIRDLVRYPTSYNTQTAP